jgi:hypothetical protein
MCNMQFNAHRAGDHVLIFHGLSNEICTVQRVSSSPSRTGDDRHDAPAGWVGWLSQSCTGSSQANPFYEIYLCISGWWGWQHRGSIERCGACSVHFSTCCCLHPTPCLAKQCPAYAHCATWALGPTTLLPSWWGGQCVRCSQRHIHSQAVCQWLPLVAGASLGSCRLHQQTLSYIP